MITVERPNSYIIDRKLTCIDKNEAGREGACQLAFVSWVQHPVSARACFVLLFHALCHLRFSNFLFSVLLYFVVEVFLKCLPRVDDGAPSLLEALCVNGSSPPADRLLCFPTGSQLPTFAGLSGSHCLQGKSPTPA